MCGATSRFSMVCRSILAQPVLRNTAPLSYVSPLFKCKLGPWVCLAVCVSWFGAGADHFSTSIALQPAVKHQPHPGLPSVYAVRMRLCQPAQLEGTALCVATARCQVHPLPGQRERGVAGGGQAPQRQTGAAGARAGAGRAHFPAQGLAGPCGCRVMVRGGAGAWRRRRFRRGVQQRRSRWR